MRNLHRFAALSLLLGICASIALAGGIGPGSPAPKLEIKKWYKGDALDKLADDKTYVVEFWATWCGPCKTSIPHLTEMAKKNSDVTFIGVSIWEDDVDDKIQKFIDEMGEKMDYRVAYSGNKEGMATSWMEAAGQNGIPSAFIIKNGVVQWIGHPMSMDKPLEEIKAGTFDLKSFKTKFDKDAEANRKMMALQKKYTEIQTMYDSGKTKEAKKTLDALIAANPDGKSTAETIKFGWLAKEDPAAWEAKAKELIESKKPESMRMVLSFVLRQNGKGGNLELARKAIEMAVAATHGKDMLVLQYAQSFYGQAKDLKNQFDTLRKISDLLPNSELKDNADFKTWLEKTIREVEAKLKGSGLS